MADAHRPVTLLFTDIEGSTRLLHELGDDYVELLAEHRRIIRAAYGAHDGEEVDTQGDSFFVAFEDGLGAVRAAAEAQRGLAAQHWPRDATVRVRMGVLTGEPTPTGEGYVGIDVHRAARISAAAHGGQVLLSHETAHLMSRSTEEGIGIRELGPQILKDLPQPEPLFQLVLDGLHNDFPPLRVHEEAPAAAGLPDYSKPPADVPLPYKGLEAFGTDDDELFYGRETLVEELLSRLERRPFLAVVGPSGSGKSSLVLAGLVPSLTATSGAAGPAWIFTPGDRPLQALADACPGLPVSEAASLAARLADEPEALDVLVADGPVGRAVIVVDQFEEIFTLCEDEDERRAFVDVLLRASAPHGSARVVVSLRADFYGHCAAFPGLVAALEHDQALVGPMSEEELRRAIERPAADAGLALEPGLVAAILRDVAGEPGALPLMSHCLVETWKRRSGTLLSLIGYLQSGGVQGAVAKTAEDVTLRLGPQEQRLARSIFLRLSALGEGTEDTRRRVSRAELLQIGGDPALVEAALAKLAAARLTTEDEHTVEVAHEALIRHWPRLRAWLNEDRAGHRIHRQLTEAAQEWARLAREPGALYRGARLETASEWAAENEIDVNELEREFLVASRTARAEELEQARRRTRRLRALAAGLAFVALAAVVSAGLALNATKHARRQTRVANSQRLAIQAEDVAPEDLALSLLLARQAHALDNSPATQRALLASLTDSPQLLGFDARYGPITGVAVAPDHTTLAVGDENGFVRLWSLRTGKPLTDRVDSGVGYVLNPKFSADQSILAVGGDDGARLLDPRTLHPMSPLLPERGPVEWLTISPDGRTLATSTARGWVHLRRVPTGAPLGDARRVSPERSTQPAFSPDGRHLVVGTHEGTAAILEPATARPAGPPLLISPEAQGYAVAFSPDGSQLATSDDRGEVVLWDWRARRSLGSLRVPGGEVYAIDFSPDGRLLAAAGDDGATAVFDTRSRRRVATLANHGDYIFATQFSGARTLLSVSGTKISRSDLDSDVLAAWRVGRGGRPINTVDLSPHGTLLAGDSRGGLVRRELGSGRSVGPRLKTGLAEVRTALWRPGGSGFVAAGASENGARGAVAVWAEAGERPTRSFSVGPDRVTAAAVSPGGDSLLVGDAGGRFALWELAGGRPRGPARRLPEQRVSAAAIAPDGSSFAIGQSSGTVSVWRTRDRKRLWAKSEPSTVQSLEWSRDGSAVVAGTASSVVTLAAATGRPQGRGIEAGVGEVLDIELVGDGRRAVVAGHDGGVALVDLDSGAREFALRGHAGRVNGLAVARGGALVVSGGSDGLLTARHLDSEWWERQACALPGRELTPRERRLYLDGIEPAPCG